MNIRELQTGDWVYNTHHEKNIRLTPYDFFTHGHDKDGCQYLTPTSKPTIGLDLEPIKLTELILEKNGFVHKMHFFWQFEIGLWRILCDTISVSIIFDGTTYVSMPIAFVHELQHALKLCRIDKEIEL